MGGKAAVRLVRMATRTRALQDINGVTQVVMEFLAKSGVTYEEVS